MCIDLYHNGSLSFIKILIKVLHCKRLYLYVYKLDGEFGKILPNDLKNAVNCLYTMYVNVNFSMNTGEWMVIIKISIISQASLMTLTRLILVGLLYDLFHQIFDQIYQLVTCNSYNTSIITPISTDSPPNDKWGLGVY